MNQAIDFALRLRVALGLAGPVLGIYVWLTQGFVGVWVVVAKNSQKLELGRWQFEGVATIYASTTRAARRWRPRSSLLRKLLRSLVDRIQESRV